MRNPTHFLLLPLFAVLLVGNVGCHTNTAKGIKKDAHIAGEKIENTGEKVGDKVNEGVKDVGEGMQDAGKKIEKKADDNR